MFDETDPMAPAPYPGAYGALKQAMNDYVGFPEIDDILGLGQEVDIAACEEEYGGEPMPLSSFYGGDEGAYGGDSGMDMGSASGGDPFEDNEARDGMRDLLSERNKKRLASSEAFQQSASKMMGGGL